MKIQTTQQPFQQLPIAIIFIASCALFIRARGQFLSIFLCFGLFQSLHAAIPIERWQHASGAQIYLVQSPSIPMLDVLMEWDGGSRRDSAGLAGLADATATLFGKGIRASRLGPALTENRISEAWADLGAGMEAEASPDRFSVGLRTLTEPELITKSVQLAARMLAAPDWPQNLWQRERARWVAALKEANTQPGTVAEAAFQKAVFGSHPYGYDATEQSLSRISVRDIAAHYQQTVQPCNALVSMVGAVTRVQADALVTQLFAGFPAIGNGNCPKRAAMPEVQPLAQGRELRIPFAAAQAQVLMGQPGYKRNDNDHFALTVGNYILGGGGFVSRLSTELREKRGLVYSAYSYFSPGLHAGAFSIGLQTRPDQAAKALQVAREVLTQYVKDGMTEAELRAAKDFYINGFALRFDSNRKLLDNIASIAWNQLPLNYLDTWIQQVEQLSVQDVRAAMARKLQPERMVTVVLGAEP